MSNDIGKNKATQRHFRLFSIIGTAFASTGSKIKKFVDHGIMMERDWTPDKAAIIDDLTGLPGAMGLFRALKNAASGGVMLIVDIDNFETICGKLGTEAGNVALRLLARCLRGSLRDGEQAFRAGSDVFALLLEGACMREAAPRAQEIAKNFSGLSVAREEERMAVYTCMSLREYGTSEAPEKFFEKAGLAMRF